VHNSDRLHRGERDAHVAVKGLHHLEFGHLHHKVSAVEDQRGHTRILGAGRTDSTGTLAKCDPSGTPSTSHWTGAAIIVQSPRTKTCIVTRPRASTRPMPFSLAG